MRIQARRVMQGKEAPQSTERPGRREYSKCSLRLSSAQQAYASFSATPDMAACPPTFSILLARKDALVKIQSLLVLTRDIEFQLDVRPPLAPK